MRFKKLVALLLVLAALAVAALAKKTALDKERRAETGEALKAETSLGAEISPAFVSKLEIKRGVEGSESMTLVKDNDRWTISSHYGTHARKEPVDELLKNLSAVRGEARSENPSVLEDFSLTDAKAIHIRLLGAGDKELAHFLLSPLRPRGTQNFIRLAGSPKVLATTADVLATLNIFSKDDKLDYHGFAEFRVAGVESSKVNSFELDPPGGQKLSFIRKEEKDKPVSWTLSDDVTAAIDAQKVNEFLSSLYNLYAVDNVDPAAHAKDFQGEPWLRLYLKPGEKPETLEIRSAPRSEEKKTRLLQVTPEGLVYELSDAQTETVLSKNREFFITKAPASK